MHSFLTVNVMSSKAIRVLPSLIQSVSKCLVSKPRYYSERAVKMRAVQIHSLGGPSVLQIDYNLPIPKPKKNEILVKVKAAGINPVDTYMRQGVYGYNPQVPIILGKEAAGEVEDIGTEVKDFKKGDRVICTMKYGAYAEYVACNTQSVIPLPDKLNFSEGAALYVSYFTAYRGLVSKCKIKKGEIVLVHGASGSVGIAAIQIAKAHGLTVVGTAGTQEGLELIKKVGADFAVNHRDEGHMRKAMQMAGCKGFDVILESRACLNLNEDMKSLREQGRIAVVGSRDNIEVDPRALISNEGTVIGVKLFSITDLDDPVGLMNTIAKDLFETKAVKTRFLIRMVPVEIICKDEFKEYTKVLLKGVEDGWVKPVIAEEYIMEDIPQAHVDVIRENGAKGKLVLLLNQKTIAIDQRAKDR